MSLLQVPVVRYTVQRMFVNAHWNATPMLVGLGTQFIIKLKSKRPMGPKSVEMIRPPSGESVRIEEAQGLIQRAVAEDVFGDPGMIIPRN